MEFNNNGNNNYVQGEQQLRKRTFNELANDSHDQTEGITMASMNMEEQLEQQSTEEKSINGNGEESSENDEINEGKLTKLAEEIDKELETSTTTMDLPRPRHRRLPPELNWQIYYCLNLPTRRKFILGLGWNFYAMFRHILLTKTKRVCNPHGNKWNAANTTAIIAADGLNASNGIPGYPNVFAEQAFPISGPLCRVDGFPGTICYYYEVKGDMFNCGLSDGALAIPDPDHVVWVGQHPNAYAIQTHPFSIAYYLGGEYFGLTEGSMRPSWKRNSVNVFGCGLLLNPKDKLAIFFTLNGKLVGKKIPINPTVDRLFPAVTMSWYRDTTFYVEANFGDDPAKPFEYDINSCPGLGLDCI